MSYEKNNRIQVSEVPNEVKSKSTPRSQYIVTLDGVVLLRTAGSATWDRTEAYAFADGVAEVFERFNVVAK